jgi:hypothetical protein
VGWKTATGEEIILELTNAPHAFGRYVPSIREAIDPFVGADINALLP